MSTKFLINTPSMTKLKRPTAKAAALILVLAMLIPIAILPAASAQTQIRKQTYAYIGALPNPAGVGQEVLLHVGITDASNWDNGPWTGLTVTVTKPDGTSETLGPFTADLTGGTGAVFIPTMVGEYTFQTHCPEQEPLKATIRGTGDPGTILEASDSAVLTLVVQTDMPPSYPGLSLPTEYWSRPIDSQIREWSTISGSWLADPENLYAPYNDGPETAHILWAKPLEMGGLVGGDVGSHSMEIGDAYEGKFINRVIINGILYYNQFNTQGRGSAPSEAQKVVAVDLHTGEELWSKALTDENGTPMSLSFGQTFYWDAFNNHGVYTYLWATSGSTWYAYDAFSGEWSFTITDVPSGSNVYGPDGEIYRYIVDLNSGSMTLWNSTKTVNPQDTSTSQDGSWGRYLYTADYPRVFPAERGIQWNKTIPKGLEGSIVATFYNDRIVGASIAPTAVRMWGISLKLGQEGTMLFDKTWTPPEDWAAGNQTVQWMASSQEDMVGVMFSKETCQNYGFSLETGDYLWGPTSPPQYYLDALDDTKSGARIIAYGKLYSASVSGIVYCYDVKTGALLWTHEATDKYTEILWANTWWMRPLFATDGKIYVGHYEHSPIDPRPRGAPFYCLDAETGQVVWEAEGLFRQTRWGGRAIIGDSIIATMDTYDQRIYAIGKGPTATTVIASKVSDSESVLIQGTVVDVSPGLTDTAIATRFPNGVPAVSDASMSNWMLYVYKQFTKPTNATGVSVHLTATDPNGNIQEIGTTTSDSLGNFAIAWNPPVQGLYNVKATFEGSGAYFGSEAGTAFVAAAAPSAAPATTVTPSLTQAPQPTSAMPTSTYLAIGVAVVVIAVVAAAALILRRKNK